LSGTALIIDLRRDDSPEDITTEVNKMRLNPVNALLTKSAFRHFLLKDVYTQVEIEALSAQTKFKRYEIKNDCSGIVITPTKSSAVCAIWVSEVSTRGFD
jgi:hypothetical protein